MRQSSEQLYSMTVVCVLKDAAEETIPRARVAGLIGGDFGGVKAGRATRHVDDEVDAGFVFQKAGL